MDLPATDILKAPLENVQKLFELDRKDACDTSLHDRVAALLRKTMYSKDLGAKTHLVPTINSYKKQELWEIPPNSIVRVPATDANTYVSLCMLVGQICLQVRYFGMVQDAMGPEYYAPTCRLKSTRDGICYFVAHMQHNLEHIYSNSENNVAGSVRLISTRYMDDFRAPIHHEVIDNSDHAGLESRYRYVSQPPFQVCPLWSYFHKPIPGTCACKQ